LKVRALGRHLQSAHVEGREGENAALTRQYASVSDAVNQAFRNEDATAEAFLQEVRQNWRDLPVAIGKAIARCIAFIALFELLLRGAVEKASISGLEITDLSLLRMAVPVIVAYHFYDIVVMSYVHLDFAAVHDALIRRRHGPIASTRLDYFLRPTQPSIVGAVFFEPGSRPIGRLVGRIGNAFFLAALGGLVVFQYYAYTEQFDQFGGDVRLYIALILSLMFTLYGYLAIITRPESRRE
jgi:hypothetical protein